FFNGFTMEFKGDPWQIVEFQHVNPGKGPAFVRPRLKNLKNGKVIDNTFPSGHAITEIRIERRQYQFLYKDDMGYTFMNNETFDQVLLQEALIDAPEYLMEGQNVEIVFYADNDEPLLCELPPHVTLEVTYTEPGVRGDTATNVTKPATLASGATIRVPIFVETGTKIRVDTKTKTYLDRVKD
nr:elongation factor P [Chitinophagales bacterium]